MEKIEIFDFGNSLEGVGKVNNKICFVDFALAGEVCECELESDNKFFYKYKLKNLLKKSNNRIEPKCKYFGICGGCDCMHIKKDKQLELKKSNLRKLFFESNINVEISDVKFKNEFNYRNKMVFPVSKFNDKTIIGMFKKNSHEVVEINRCEIADEKINEVFCHVKKYISENNIEGYDFEKNEGFLKYVVLRKIGNKISLIFVVSESKENAFVKLNQIPVDQIYVNVNKSNKEILGKELKFLCGQEKLFSNELGIIYEVNPLAFLQVNNQIKNEIYGEVLKNISDKVVVDAYSGAGLLSAIISKKAKKVYGIEVSREASKCAVELALKNNVKNLENINGDCSKILPRLIRNINEKFTLVVDPPRAGVSKNILTILNNSALCEEILYISCNPKTLVRDIKLLTKYDIIFVKPYDMFPQTKHVETFVKLRRKKIVWTNLSYLKFLKMKKILKCVI